MTFLRCRGYMGESCRQPPHDTSVEEFYSYKPTQCRRCYLAYAAEWRSGRSARGLTTISRSYGEPSPGLVLDGVDQLTEVLALAGLSVVQAVAKYTIFLPPETVAQTRGQPLFPVIRNIDMAKRGTIEIADDGRGLLLDDNTSPTKAFLWSGGLRRGREVQFNHLWTDSRNPLTYTALWNLCATPDFLAKTTDGSNYPEVVAALRYRAYSLYGMSPPGLPTPTRPNGYNELEWAPHPPPVEALEAQLRARLRTTPKSRPAVACREIGWLFSDLEA